MFHTAEKVRKNVITSEGESEFQIRYMKNEDVGILTARSGKSYLILDSGDYWYDVIQSRYPSKQKCRCKNDYFRLSFDYVPRVGTDDYRAVQLISRCTECGREKIFAEIPMDYSPTAQLFERPITYCERPKIKYKTYSIGGYWKEDAFGGLIDLLLQKQLRIYGWYWAADEDKRYVEAFSAEELKHFLFVEKRKYIDLYFSMEPLEDLFARAFSDERGVCVDRDIWRKRAIVKIKSPFLVASEGAGYFYSMEFSCEYIEAGQVKAKDRAFCRLAEEILAYSREKL